MPETLTLENYRDAWNVGEMRSHFCKTVFIVLPALFLILFLSSMVAFACTRFSWRFNVFFLRAVHRRQPDAAAGDLPAAVPDVQVDAVARLAQRHQHRHLLGTKIAVILIHVAFQTGFCTFVLSQLHEDDPEGAQRGRRRSTAPAVPRQFFAGHPPAHAGRRWPRSATLEFTWLYNDFFWGAVLLQPGRRAADHVVDRGARTASTPASTT